MPAARPFRFATAPNATATAAEYVALARRVEALGYAVLLTGDHFARRWFEPGPALTAAALTTSTLRVSCTVFANDFRTPALLAKEAATIDVLTDGRFEFGIGAGWDQREYREAGIPFDPPGVRVGRLEEAVWIIKGLWGDGPVTHAGRHYTVDGLEGWPKPVQRPHPPIFIGGGQRVLGLAAREANIVGFLEMQPRGDVDLATGTEAGLTEKVGWVREAAGDRFDALELAMLVTDLAVTDDRPAAAERLAGGRAVSAAQVLASPYSLIGSVEEIVEELLALRERHGISYISVLHRHMEAFAPVVARLAGQ
jgi:probable F420-dependent oxidoreductase